MLLSLEMHNVGAFVVSEAGATRKSCMGLGRPACRGQRTWQTGNGGSPGTWEILSSPPEDVAVGVAAPENSWSIGFRRLGPIEANDEAHRVVPPSEGERSAAGRVAGSRSVLIVLLKSGDGYHPDPMEGSGASDHGAR